MTCSSCRRDQLATSALLEMLAGWAERQIAQIRQRQRAAGRDLREHDQRLDGFEVAIAALASAAGDQRAAVEALAQQAGGMFYRLDLIEQLLDLDAEIAREQRQTIETLACRLDQLDQVEDRQDSALTELESRVLDLESRLDRTRDALAAEQLNAIPAPYLSIHY